MRFRRVSPVGRVTRGRVLGSSFSPMMVELPGWLAIFHSQTVIRLTSDVVTEAGQ